MYFIHELPKEADEQNTRCKELVGELLTGIEPLKVNTKIPSQCKVYEAPERQGKLYVLKDGTLSYMRDGKVLFYFDPGDLVGVEHAVTKGGSAEVLSDFAVVVDTYDADTVLQAIHSDKQKGALWSEFLVRRSTLLALLAAYHIKDEITTPPDIAAYRTGQTIIEQGSRANDVYTLIEGEAEAYVDGVKVGDILSGEIFGVIAALTGIPRTASVIATKPCTVLGLPKENFVHLVKTRPGTFLKVVEDMARTMVELNEQVVALSLSKF